MKAFSRSDNRDTDRPRSMVYTGTNGHDLMEWSRDEDTNARFQWRPELPDEPARVLLLAPFRQWVVVPVGSTISLDRDDDLHLELPKTNKESE